MRNLFLLLFISKAFATTLIVPSDQYPTIQSGIDAATVGDTVLVSDGMYDENLILDKSIVLASHAVYDDLSEWVDNNNGEWVTTNSHIQNTHIIGNNPVEEDYGSCILITSNDDCISPEIIGFTIRDGLGTRVKRVNSEDEIYFLRLGGGILSDISDPLIHYNQFKDNGSNDIFAGGGVYATTEPEDWGFDNTLLSSSRCEIDTVRVLNNLYDNNTALFGNSFANKYFENYFDMRGSVFDRYYCLGVGSEVSSAWVTVEPQATINYEGSVGNTCGINSPEIFIDSSESECNNDSCGSQTNPFKTITTALEWINPSESDPITLYLVGETYSPISGEIFPLVMIDYISLIGNDPQETILDADSLSQVILFENIQNSSISNLTIKNGLTFAYYDGGGLHFKSSEVHLDNLINSFKGIAGYPIT